MGVISVNDFLFEIDEIMLGILDIEIVEVIDFDIQGGEVIQQDFSMFKGKCVKFKFGKFSQVMLVFNVCIDMFDFGQSVCCEVVVIGVIKLIKVMVLIGEIWIMSGYFINEFGVNGSIDNSVNIIFNLFIDGDIIIDDGGV